MIICKLIKHVVPGSQPQINRPFVYSLSRGLSTSNMLLFGWLTDIGSNEGPHMYCRLNLEEKRSHALCAQSSVDVGMKGVSQAVEAIGISIWHMARAKQAKLFKSFRIVG
ncbi:Melibiase family protein [Trifolium repens]|nr:Melibiase family protein [Trifolium repens]